MSTLRKIGLWLQALALAAASLTCGGDVAAPEPRASELEVVGGNDQTGVVGQMLPQPLVVQVKDAQAQPLAGVAVLWITSNGGGLSQSSVVTGSDGQAAVQWTLGATAGQQTATATVPDLPAVLFTATAEAGPQPHLVIITQPSGTTANAVPLAQQPMIRVEDGSGQPLGAGIPVTASVAGATLSGTTVIESDAAGAVQFTGLALSGAVGTYWLTFSSPGFIAVQSIAITLSGASSHGQLVVAIEPSTAAENGVPLLQQPAVRAEDGAGQPLGAGIPVTAAVEGATLTGTTMVETDGSGIAHFSDLALSGAPGSYRLTFSAADLEAVQSAAILLAATSGAEGKWTAPFEWPIVAVHMVLLPTGEVLSVGRHGTPQIWNPASGQFTPVPPPAWLFCAGHALLADGRVLVAGGHISDRHGLPNITLFSGGTNQWTSSGVMARGRWYPTATTMGNGEVVILAGTDEDEIVVPIPEVWSNGTIRQLTGAEQPLPWYPRAFLTPDGEIFVAGPAPKTRFLTVAGSGHWRLGPAPLFTEGRDYGAAVMYDDGKILYAGGGNTTNTAEVIDLNQVDPHWSWTSPMAFARRHHNLTALPTGEMLATGGVAGTLFDDVSKGVHAAELWDPTTGNWTTLASNAVTRGYHGTSLLLPDGRVLNAGSGDGAGAPDERNAEIFSPPYLFRGARPTIASLPSEIRYGEQFRIVTPQATAITGVSFIRLGAVTHAFDENQRFQWLSFTSDATGLTVTAPSSSNRAPPGHYLVFILGAEHVPSIGKIVRIF